VSSLRKVIVVTGTPGVGKSTVSRLLAEKLGAKYINLGDLAKEKDCIIGFDEERDSYIVDTEKLRRAISDVIEETSCDLVLDGHLSPQSVPPKYVSIVFVLRRDPDDLKRTLEKKGFYGKKLKENLEVEILDVCLCDAVEVFGKSKICEIDITDKNVGEVLSEVISVIQGESPCQIGTVDWLGKLDAENRLRDFLE